MKEIDETYKEMLNNNINNKSNYDFYNLIKRIAVRYDTSTLRAYWILSRLLCSESNVEGKLSGY